MWRPCYCRRVLRATGRISAPIHLMKIWMALVVCLLARGSLLSAQVPSAPPQQTPAVIAGAQQQQRRAIAAARIDASEKIVLDGQLDELAWSRAIPASNFIQQD